MALVTSLDEHNVRLAEFIGSHLQMPADLSPHPLGCSVEAFGERGHLHIVILLKPAEKALTSAGSTP